MTTALTITGGDGDADRSGYWMVSGPQHPRDVYGQIERTRIYADDGGARVTFMWYLMERVTPDYPRYVSEHMQTRASGEAATLDDALNALSDAWPTWLNDA